MTNSGIYKILNWANDKVYIGSATYLNKRISEHKLNLLKGKHKNKFLQASWDKYGASVFTFVTIELCDKALLIEREQFWIDKFKSTDDRYGYNLCKVAGNTAGLKWTDEQRVKYLSKRIGSKRPQEEKDKISLGMKGKKNRLGTRHNQITRLKMGEANRRRNGNDAAISNVLTMENGKWR